MMNEPQRAVPPLRDQEARDSATYERSRNVVVDAGAGTGKTTLIVNRLLNLVAPEDDGPAIPLSRIAALTFTRRAAGDLNLKIRTTLLSRRSEDALTELQRQRIDAALGELDGASIGTIHSFCDRMLQEVPMEAGVSPAYQVVEDDEFLIEETFGRLLRPGLRERLLGTDISAELIDEAEATFRAYRSAGLLVETEHRETYSVIGLDAFVHDAIMLRDRQDVPNARVDPDLAAFRDEVGALLELVPQMSGDSPGVRWWRNHARILEGLLASEDFHEVFRAAVPLTKKPQQKTTKRHTFGGDAVAWKAWKTDCVHERIARPLMDVLAHRLIRTIPVIRATYDEVKRELKVLDPLDLVLKLRSLLRNDLEARSRLQRRFDHFFVDEVQDTDPLQCEILAFLAEAESQAELWSDVRVAPGKVTIVGDPKQSIYRFRRADLGTYAVFRKLLLSQEALPVSLTTNFRSAPSLVGWFNERFDAILGAEQPGEAAFDSFFGTVRNAHLTNGRREIPGQRVHILSHDTAGLKADEARGVEGRALARYLRWLVDESGLEITDPITHVLRPVRLGDVAVLAVSTRSLRFLLPELDKMGLPFATRGGRLFLEDLTHRRFLAAASGLADRDDGGGKAAALLAPFFAVDPAALAWAIADREDPRAAPAVEAREVLRSLRQGLLTRSVGSSLRELVESTGFGRVLAQGANAEQRLNRLGELLLRAEAHALEHGLDFDMTASGLRAWGDHPFELNPPYPLGDEAVQVMTVHQAKGLEFPVVVLWDGRLQRSAFLAPCAFRIGEDGAWSLRCKELKADSPRGGDLTARERSLLTAERLRVMYVAATRARDLLVVPRSERAPRGAAIVMDSLSRTEVTGEHVLVLETYRDEQPPAWARVEAGPLAEVEVGESEGAMDERWQRQAAEVARPRTRPAGAAEYSKSTGAEVESGSSIGRAGSRFGPVFGQVVHAAIARVVMGRSENATAAVAIEARVAGLDEDLNEAAEDVERAVRALGEAGLLPGEDVSVAFEVPLAAMEGDALVSGYADLVVQRPGELVVVDFKSDLVDDEVNGETFPVYAEQVRVYCRTMGLVGGGTAIRGALLFTGRGRVAWIGDSPPTAGASALGTPPSRRAPDGPRGH